MIKLGSTYEKLTNNGYFFNVSLTSYRKKIVYFRSPCLFFISSPVMTISPPDKIGVNDGKLWLDLSRYHDNFANDIWTCSIKNRF